MKYIGVMGCSPTLPSEFPIDFPENSGNMVHANAPFEMFDNCVFIKDDVSRYGSRNFVEFVNKNCSHLIVTLANTLRVERENGEKYARMRKFLEQITRPIVIFGLGVQSKSYDLDAAVLPPEAIAWLQFLSERCVTLGVRGPYTKAVVEKLSGIRNVEVVGCPSLFSRPQGIAALRHSDPGSGRPAYAGTHYGNDLELRMLMDAIEKESFLIEPVNRFNHKYYLHTSRGGSASQQVPYFLEKEFQGEDRERRLTMLAKVFRANYRLFRSTAEWYQFNQEMVSFTYGTRFHVNMASIISGRPALWVTHDARTLELTNYLNLPAIPLELAAHMSLDDIAMHVRMEEFFDNIGKHFCNFNSYLRTNGLPEIKFNF